MVSVYEIEQKRLEKLQKYKELNSVSWIFFFFR